MELVRSTESLCWKAELLRNKHLDKSCIFLSYSLRLDLSLVSWYLSRNNSLLEDKNFVEELKENIKKYKEKYGCLNDKRLYWEMIKMEIRSFTLFFSKRRAKQRRNEEEGLQRELCNLQEKVGVDPSEENVSEFHNVKFQLNQLSLFKTQGPGP